MRRGFNTPALSSAIAAADVPPAPMAILPDLPAVPKPSPAVPSAAAPAKVAPAPAPARPTKPKANARPSDGKKGKGQKQESKREPMPWDDANPRVVAGFQLRLPEPLHRKLAWIAANTPGQSSIHAFVLAAVEAAVAARLGSDGHGVKMSCPKT